MPYFMEKFLPPLTDSEKQTLDELSKKDLSSYSEQDVREEFLAPLIGILGYARDKDYTVLRSDQFQTSDWIVQLGSQAYKLDYRFVVWKQGFWLLEAKKAAHEPGDAPPNLTDEHVQQAFAYAIHPKVDAPLFAVSNGWQTKLYDRDTDSLVPMFSFTQAELPRKFEGFRQLVDARQITFHIKRKLLARIRQVLAADVSLERGEEFVREVERIRSDVTPLVVKNMSRASELSEDVRKKRWHAELEASGPGDLVEVALRQVHFPHEVEDIAAAVAKQLFVEPEGVGPTTILLALAILSPARPVLHNYYVNLLTFLDVLATAIPATRKFEVPGSPAPMTLKELTCWWADVLLDHLRPRPELRMLWLLEGIYFRVMKRLLVYGQLGRTEILRTVDMARYHLPEESIAMMGPSPARTVLHIVEAVTTVALSHDLRSFYDRRQRVYDHAKAMITHKALVEFERTVEAATPDYAVLLSTLPEDWHELQTLDDTHRYIDNLGPGVCQVLAMRPHLLRGLTNQSWQKLSVFAALGFDAAKSCCQILSVTVPNLEQAQKNSIVTSLYLP